MLRIAALLLREKTSMTTEVYLILFPFASLALLCLTSQNYILLPSCLSVEPCRSRAYAAKSGKLFLFASLVLLVTAPQKK